PGRWRGPACSSTPCRRTCSASGCCCSSTRPSASSPLPVFFHQLDYEEPFADPWAFVQAMVVPWIVLALPFAAVVMRLMQAGMLQTLETDYVRARADQGAAAGLRHPDARGARARGRGPHRRHQRTRRLRADHARPARARDRTARGLTAEPEPRWTTMDAVKPNIVYLHSHDTGRYVEPYGHPVPTPNIQRLADQGVLFREAFCAAPTCSASRACLLTGQYGHNNGMMGLAHRGWSLNDYRQHLVHPLHDAGYHTVLIGEQHVAKRPDIIGFDRVVTIESSHVESVAP